MLEYIEINASQIWNMKITKFGSRNDLQARPLSCLYVLGVGTLSFAYGTYPRLGKVNIDIGRRFR